MHIFGRNAVLEALAKSQSSEHRQSAEKQDVRGGATIEKIFLQYGAEGAPINAIRQQAQKCNVPCATMDKRKFADLEYELCGERGGAQGVIALVPSLTILTVSELLEQAWGTLEEPTEPIFVALDGINDPHNLGAIARSAECAGAAGLIVPEQRSAPLSGAAMKTSAGALEHLPVARTGSLAKALQDCKNAGFRIVGLDVSGTKAYTDALYSEAVVIVIGSEGQGMNRQVVALCDDVISIPLHGKIASLNASVATAIVLFEAARQRAHEEIRDHTVQATDSSSN